MNKNSKIIISLVAIIITATFIIISVNPKNTVMPKSNSVSSIESTIANNATEQNEKIIQPPVIQDTIKVESENKKPEILKYVIKPGDTLESIAKSYGIKVSTIAESNGLSKSDNIKEGQELVFPSVNGVLYKIKNNETLWELASIYNININDMVAVNNMDSPDKLKIGQQIIIPGIDKLKIETKIALENKTTSRNDVNLASRGETSSAREIELLPWFGKVDNIYKIGDVAIVTDVETGLKMKIKRTFGANHADVETLTAEDTATLKKAAGGSWNWTRRPVVVEIDGYRIAGSLTAMPHAGRDDKPAISNVSGRSGGYGYGENLDAVKGNGMDGQFDIHFYGSKTHATSRVDEAHQTTIQKAYKSGL